jgi:hypothetical protein
MRAFAGMPRVESPKKTFGDKRIFELRTYESHSQIKAQKKIDMFNKAGEIQIFRDTGLTPVFFGETVFGRLMPNLTYMLVFLMTWLIGTSAGKHSDRVSGGLPSRTSRSTKTPYRISPTSSCVRLNVRKFDLME